MPPTTVLYARSMGPYRDSSREAWRVMDAWLDRRQARGRVKQAYGYFRDDPARTPPDLLRYDACVPVTFGLEPDAEIRRQTLAGGTYAVHIHVGPYAETGELLSRLHREIVPRRGLSVDYDRPFVAVYLNDPLVTREAHRRMELCIPVLPIQMPLATNDDAEGEMDISAIARRIAN
jgi:AraC family transcriptional regulator